MSMNAIVERVTIVAQRFVPVRCQVCRKLFSYAAPGSKIQFKCPKCKTLQIAEV